jgi:hypothetical protein
MAAILASGLQCSPSAAQYVITPPANVPAASTTYEFQVYEPGVDPASGKAFRQLTIQSSAVTCDVTPMVTPPIAVNPTRVEWTDPDHPGRVCRTDATEFLRSLPPRSEPYLATITMMAASVASAPSAPSNIFMRTPIAP